MSTITAILEPQPDGTLHVPIPDELRHGKVKLVATLEIVPPVNDLTASVKPAGRKAGSLKGTFWMSPDFDEPLDDFKDYM
ncbi:MAG: DUF2281 domain-containing protein [Planctomycetota bacterium]